MGSERPRGVARHSGVYGWLGTFFMRDLAAASEEAHAALRLQPEWSYVRDVLLPQIEAAQRK